MNTKLLIIELDYQGHRLQYVRIFVEALLKSKKNIILVLNQAALRSNEYQVHLAEFEKIIIIKTIPFFSQKSELKKELKKLLIIHKLAKKIKPSRIYIPYGDGLSQAAVIFGYNYWSCVKKIPHEVVIMRGNYAYPKPAKFKKYLRNIVNEWLVSFLPWNRIHFLDPLVFEYLKNKPYSIRKRSFLLPEPLEKLSETIPKNYICQQLGIDASFRYVVTAGAHTKRKGTDLLIEIFIQNNFGSKVRLLVAGKLDSELKAQISRYNQKDLKNIIFMDFYLQEQEFQNVLDVADIIVTPYLDHQGSSGIVARAIQRGKPIIGVKYGWIGWILEQYPLGFCCSNLEHEIVNIIFQILNNEYIDVSVKKFQNKFNLWNNKNSFSKCVITGLNENKNSLLTSLK